MSRTPMTPESASRTRTFFRSHGVLVFCATTVSLSVAALLLMPLLVGPALVVFIPALVAMTLIALSDSRSQIGPRLFSRRVWRISWRWVVISLAVAIGLRLAVAVVALALGYSFHPGPLTPLLLVTLLFAAAEQTGWRGYALPRLLQQGWSPLAAALALGVPWAMLHLPLTLPGKLSAGAPPLAQFCIIMSMSVLTTWAFLGSGRSLTAAVLLHGGQNALSILNDGLPPAVVTWIMAGVYLAAAALVIVLTKARLGQKEERSDQ